MRGNRSRCAKGFAFLGAAAFALVATGIGPVAGAVPDRATPSTQGPKIAKSLVPPAGQRRRLAPLSTERLAVHSRSLNGPVSRVPEVYLVFWGSQWSNDPASAASALQAFYQGLGGVDDTWSAIMSQYCAKPAKTTALPSSTCDAKSKYIQHPTTTPLRGVWFDNATPAPHAATYEALAVEAYNAAQHFGKTSAKLNRNAQYVIASPSGTDPDGFPGYCAYHTWTRFVSPAAARMVGKLVWTNLPYVPDIPAASCSLIPNSGVRDGYLISASHEYAETVTDFVDGGWWSGTDPGSGEIGDLCGDGLNTDLEGYITLNTGTFAAEGLFSNAANGCRLSG